MLRSQLRSFHAVATEGGFTAASRVINVGQPTISSQIKALEDQYGVTLFHRKGRKVILSDCGKDLLRISKRILFLEEEAQNLLVNYGGLLTGTLRVGAVGPYHATEMLGSFNKKYPGIKLAVTQRNSLEMVNLLHDYTIDVAVLAHTEENVDLYSQPFSRHEVVVFVNATHPFASRGHIEIEELQGQRFLHRENGSTTRAAFQKALDHAGVTINPVMELGSREAVWLAVQKGIGIGVVSNIEFNAHPNLRTVRISNAKIYTTAHVTCLNERKDSGIIQTFFNIADIIKPDIDE